MFIKPKKVKGIEKGTFVVLRRSVREAANVDISLNTGLYYNKYMEIMYVVDADFMRTKELVECIPIMFDKRSSSQLALVGRKGMATKKKMFLYHKDSLQPLLYDIKSYAESRADNPDHLYFTQNIQNINYYYKDILTSRGLGQIDLKKWGGS